MFVTRLDRKFLSVSFGFIGLFIIAFIIFAKELVVHKLNRFDMTVINWIQSMIAPANTSIMKFFTFIGSPPIVAILVILCAVIMYWQRKRWESAGFIVANASGAVFNQILKEIFHRQRPDIHRMIAAHGYSFPSGHSMGSVVFYGTVTYFICLFARSTITKWIVGVSGFLVIMLIGVSRIYLGVHYPSDVIGGYTAGGVWLVTSIVSIHLIVKKNR